MKFWHRFKINFLQKRHHHSAESLDHGQEARTNLSPLTVEQLHAVLTTAMSQGLGHRPVEIELTLVDGQLCGMPAAVITNAVIDWGWWGMGKTGKNVRLRPNRTLVAVHQ